MIALHIGLLVNPVAGVGGVAALKGSDGMEARHIAAASEGGSSRAARRMCRALAALAQISPAIRFSTWAGSMGEPLLDYLPRDANVLGEASTHLTTGEDTKHAARMLRHTGVDIIVFAGGDGTARDIYDALGEKFPVLGVPAGVKMHSGVFAVSPEAAGELLVQLATGGLVGLRAQEVRDIDEAAFREGVVRSRFYGEMQVPGEGRYLQHTKIGGRESPELVAADIAAWLVETMLSECTYLIGPGSTTAAIMAQLQLPNTLLGVDVIRDTQLLASDADEATLMQTLNQYPGEVRVVVTIIGGQGHIFGRGNQQFSPQLIRCVGLDNIIIVAAKSKVTELQGRPMFVDTNDADLDLELTGFRPVVTGYDDQILYRVASVSL